MESLAKSPGVTNVTVTRVAVVSAGCRPARLLLPWVLYCHDIEPISLPANMLT